MLEKIAKWFTDLGMAQGLADALSWIIIIIGLFVLAYLSNLVAKKLLLKLVSFLVRRSRTKWDDALHTRKFFLRFSHLAPVMVFYFGSTLLPDIQGTLRRLSLIYMYCVGLLVFDAFLNALIDIYRTYEVSKGKPIKGYLQIVKIIAFLIVGVIIISTLFGRSPLVLLSGLGAMTAVLLFVFKDTILGLVASLQLSFNNIIQIGDWIEMSKFGADGEVMDISLHVVKVQNWDKTISTIPTYALVSNSFKNWRGMSESGGRRIKRSLNIDMNSIKFCTKEMLERFRKFQLLKDYLARKL